MRDPFEDDKLSLVTHLDAGLGHGSAQSHVLIYSFLLVTVERGSVFVPPHIIKVGTFSTRLLRIGRRIVPTTAALYQLIIP